MYGIVAVVTGPDSCMSNYTCYGVYKRMYTYYSADYSYLFGTAHRRIRTGDGC